MGTECSLTRGATCITCTAALLSAQPASEARQQSPPNRCRHPRPDRPRQRRHCGREGGCDGGLVVGAAQCARRAEAGAHMLSPRRMYSPSCTSSTPASFEKTRSRHSSRMTFVVWSKPLSRPMMLRPSLVTTCTTLSTMPSNMAAMGAPAGWRPAYRACYRVETAALAMASAACAVVVLRGAW